MKLGGNFILVGILIFSLIQFVVRFSNENGSDLSFLSHFSWIGVGFFVIGIILLAIPLIKNKVTS